MYIYYDELIKREIVLYKIGKFQQDIEDFFCELNIQLYIDDSAGYDELNDKSVISTVELTKDRLADALVIICGFDCHEESNLLESLGFQYKKDFIAGIDLINMLEERETYELVNYAPNKKIIVFGTGASAKKLMRANPHLRVHYFIDNDETKWGETFFSRPVKGVDELLNENMSETFVLAATSSVAEIKKQLLELGLLFGKDFYFYDSSDKNVNPARLMEETIKSRPQYKYDCDYMNRYPVQFRKDHLIWACCSKTKVYSGNLLLNSIDNIDKSVYTKILWLGVINRTYASCKTDSCIFLMSHTNKTSIMNEGDVKRSATKVSDHSLLNAEMLPSYDKTCNYKCKSCRDRILVNDYVSDAKLISAHTEFLKLLPRIQKLTMAGGGEVFASKFYKEILFEKYESDSVRIITNGSLLDESVCRRLFIKYKHVGLDVSLHAAKPETYENLHSADFNVVYSNLKRISDIRKNNHQINSFILRFIVQKDNFREMPEFIELGLELNVDNIWFRPILKWPVLSSEAFKMLNVYDPLNPYHYEFLEILQNPLFKNTKVMVDGI